MNMLHTFSNGVSGAGAGAGAGNEAIGDIDLKERLISNVKKEVKQLMEESVTKKYVHEQSGSVTALCASVEACLSHCLRRRALGLFKTSSTTALIQKIAKTCPEANYVSRRLMEIELTHYSHSNAVSGKRSSSSSDSIIKPKVINKGGSSSSSVSTINTISGGSTTVAPLPPVKYLWIRIALHEKRLAKIIEYLVNNANTYYDREALVADANYGSILSSLLMGPCALEYTRAKTADYYWSDPCADELVQRHRISSGNRTPPTTHRPIINFKRSLHTSSEDTSSSSFKINSPASVAKDYVESLHQNTKTTLLYGKNNVLVLPKDTCEPIPGYLSLHQNVQSLTIKWTPNQLMNGFNDTDCTDKSFYWSYALNINVDEIVYVHCHQNRDGDTGGVIILVGQDGVQRSPIHFPEGGHLQAFLSCLETGLLPHGQLDPPLWSQHGNGKLFPCVRRRILPSVMESTDETPIDYVFRVVSKSQHEEFLASHPILDVGRSSPRRKHLASCSTTGSSDCSSKSLSIDQSATEAPLVKTSQTASIELVCSTMRRQIISRAFYGWLAYRRHLSTVRTHLSGLVNGHIMPDLDSDDRGLTKEKWDEMHVDGVITSDIELFRIVYFGGVEHEIRKYVWPYLLGHYSFGSTPEEREKYDESCKRNYETTMSEWLAVEAIVRQREKEKTALALAKLSAENANHLNVLGLDDGMRQMNGPHDGTVPDDDEKGNDVSEYIDFSDPCDESINEAIEIVTTNGVPESIPNFIEEDIVDEEKLVYKNDNEVIGNDELEEETDTAEGEGEEENISKDVMPPEYEKCADNEPICMQKICLVDEAAGIEAGIGLTSDLASSNNMLVLSIKSSPSTSSYETIGNEFNDSGDLTVQQYVVKNEEYADPTVLIIHNQEREQSDSDDELSKPPESDKDSQKIGKFHSADDMRNYEENQNSTQNDVQQQEQSDSELPVDETMMCKVVHVNDTPMIDDSNVVASLNALQEPKSACVSPASSNGGVYSMELLETFSLNLHRIEKDVQRCDRKYWYFLVSENLDKLRNIMSTYVWEHLDIGYLQGMCDIVAPLLVIFDDESLCYNCFCKLMERSIDNFPNGGAMDMHFANMRSLIQILDSEMYDLMDSNGDYTHFYFCYRWFLLDFKRELVYDDVFATWEIIWAAKHVASEHFVLFLALALLETYRDIILSNSMDFTDVIKFFNEMAEQHDAQSILQLSRSLVLQLQTIIENK